MTKKCPFNLETCNEECSLYISSDELNDTVKNKLASIGIINKGEGMCSIKNLAMCASRSAFENSNSNFYR